MTETEQIQQIIQEKNDYYINYIEGISNVYCRKNAKDIFKVYSENKAALFKALGNKMKVSKHIHVTMDKTLMMKRLDDFYHPVEYLYYDNDLYGINNSYFICDVVNYIYNHFSSKFRSSAIHDGSKCGEAEELLDILGYILRHDNMYDQKTTDFMWVDIESLNKKVLKFPEGMRPMRALRKFLEYINYPNMNLFNDFRNKVSYILTNKEVSGTINISIDPIDFLTLSNNNSNWGSCMKIPEGSYCQSVTAMLNSPYALVAYFSNNEKSFVVNDVEYPNKTWRVLLFFDIDRHRWICNNKEYPYYSSQLLQEVFSLFCETLNKTMDLKFTEPFCNSAYSNIAKVATDFYEGECYDDDDDYDYEYYDEDDCIESFYEKLEHDDYEAVDWITERIPQRKVAIETSPYYNDLFNNPMDKFPKILLNENCPSDYSDYVDVAGPVTCLFCGTEQPMHTYFMQEYYLEDYENNLSVCADCNKFNEFLSSYEVPVLTHSYSFIELREDLKKVIINAGEEYSYEKMMKIIQDNLYVEKDNELNKLIHRHIPLMKFNKDTIKFVNYLKCQDKDFQMTLFTTLSEKNKFYDYKIGFYNKEENEIIKTTLKVSALDVSYMGMKINEKYLKSRDWYRTILDNGEEDLVYFDMILPISFRKYIGRMEVVDDRETKFKALQSIQTFKKSC